MKKNIKNEEINEEIVNEGVEEIQQTSDEQKETKETEEPRELTPEEKITELEKQIEELKKQQLYQISLIRHQLLCSEFDTDLHPYTNLHPY